MLASINVSSTRRSGWRSRVITGAATLVNSSVRSPHATAQETLRSKRCSASRAIAILRSRVSSRKAAIRPIVTSLTSMSEGSPDIVGVSIVIVTVISSRSTSIDGGVAVHSAGSRPANHEVMEVVSEADVMTRHYVVDYKITILAMSQRSTPRSLRSSLGSGLSLR